MMPYDFVVDGSTDLSTLHGVETKENMHLYSATYSQQDSFLKSNLTSNNMITNSDLWSTTTSNSNPNNGSFYFPSTFDLNMSTHPSQYSTIDNSNNYDYQALPDLSSSYLTDPYSQMFTNNYSLESYNTPTSYNSNSMDYASSNYLPTTDSYQQIHSMYSNSNGSTSMVSSYLPPTQVENQSDYQSTISQWDSTMMKMRSHDVTSASNSSNSSTSASKQPCLVCHEESSGYHFGAYTCESCKAFYRRATKDPRVQIKHSCEVPLPNITKSNRKDCRACRKAKCDRVGMTAMPKDRPSRTTTKTTPKSASSSSTSSSSSSSSSILVTELLEQLARDLVYDQLTSSSAFENLLRLIDLPMTHSISIDCHSIYTNAMQIWRNQSNPTSQTMINVVYADTFVVLLFLFRTFMILTEHDEDQSNTNSKFDKLVNILQQEIQRLTGSDHRSACRIKALFMKCYVALAQYPNSTTLLDNNNLSHSQYHSYPQYPVYGQ